MEREKNGRRGGKEERKDRIATPLPIAAREVQAPVEAPVQSSWHTYELCIRCSLCVIARCIIIPERKFLLRFHLARDIRGTDGKMQDGARANSDGSLHSDGAGGSLFRIENTFQEVGSHCLFLNGLFPWMASRFAERRLSNDDCG